MAWQAVKRGSPLRRGWGWLAMSIGIAMLVIVPVAVVLSSVLRDSGGAWQHLAQTRLADYATNTLILAVCVCALAMLMGTVSAWVVTMHRFPGRSVFAWALLLPLAMPAYISAYSLTDLLQHSGPVQSWLRDTALAGTSTWFPHIRSFPGAVLVLACALSPYVYLAARASFATLPRSAIESSRTLGNGPLRSFLRVALPLARPALVAAGVLVVMETVADFGTVDYFAIDTFATGIYRTWFGLESQVAASQLSSLLLMFVFALVLTESAVRRRRRFHHTSARTDPPRPTALGPLASAGAVAACGVPIIIGFIVPASWLVVLAISKGDARSAELFAGHATNTFLLASASALLAVVLGLLVVFIARLRGGGIARISSELCRAGYAVPGPVIAIGVLVALGWMDRRINGAWVEVVGGQPLGLILTGSVVALLVGYQTRFLAVTVSLIESGYARVHRHLDDAARTLGARPLSMLLRVHVPALGGTLAIAGLLVFVDVVKELPATLMLRPFNFDTLAVRVYQLASDERLGEAAPGALAIVVVGIIPAIVLARVADGSRGASEKST